MAPSFSDITLGINTAVLCFICVDYIKFRINFRDTIGGNFVQREVCELNIQRQDETLKEIKKKLDNIEIKIDNI